jgi:hypothetical protein
VCRKTSWHWFTLLSITLTFGTATMVLNPVSVPAQATVSLGSIQGTILDPRGGVTPEAKVTVTSRDTRAVLNAPVSDSGDFSLSALTPGTYIERVEVRGFKTVEKTITVQVGVVANGTVTLEVGEITTVVTVKATTVAVNTDQAIVSGILTTAQIEDLPINGRNFLDLAQLEPGVQIQDGNNFDPTKVGYSSISFGGRFGRTARIEVDGVDVSDETVGTTTTNIPASAIQEFQLSQSSLDLSNELTSSGAVNVATRSGTNSFHGQAFGLFRDSDVWSANLPHPAGTAAPYQRTQVGGNFGGAIIKDKLFFFMDAEHTIQHLFAPLALSAPFTALGTGYSSPFKENDLLGKMDYIFNSKLKLFYRFGYFDNYAVSAAPVGLNPYLNKNYTRTHVVGADYTTGFWAHSFRFEYLKFQNQILDATLTSGLPLSTLGASLNVGSLYAGPSYLAPQTTLQSDHQYKYDGSKGLHNHIIRFGASINHLQGGGFFKFFSINPFIINLADSASVATANTNPFGPGGDTNPLNYPVQIVYMGNGLGFSTEKPAFGYPYGGLGPDNRLGLYVGDTWKFEPNLTITAGLRYDRDTGRADSDLNNPAFATVVNSFFPGYGNRVNQPNKNFAPQLGVAWDPWKNGKTSVRAGVGLYYENVIWNSVLFDRPLRLSSGGFLAISNPCVFGTIEKIPFGDGTVHQISSIDPNACTEAIGAATPAIIDFQNAYQASFPPGASIVNPNYLPTLLAGGSSAIPPGFFDPNYLSPRSFQLNIGFQRQLWEGGVLSVDYLRNVGTHYQLGQDANHVGDVHYFNLPAAQGAIDRSNTSFGCPVGAAGVSCAIAAGATMSSYASNGLGTPSDTGYSICDTATTGYQCAFGGQTTTSPAFVVQKPIGRSVYNGLQIKWVQNVDNPVRGLKNLNLQAAYALSQFDNAGGAGTTISANDQDFVNNALDNANPLHYFGPSTLSRKNQLSFGGVAKLPYGFQLGFVGHFYSALPVTLYVPTSSTGGEIFRTDFTGDGTMGDPVPSTKLGAFGNSISGVHQLNQLIRNYNATQANQVTPAGATLISNGLFTLSQLQALGGVAPSITTPPTGQVSVFGLRDVDVKVSYAYKFKEWVTIEPSIGFYNAFNLANFDLPNTLISGLLNGTPGSLNGTTYSQQTAQRVGVGTGVYSLGSPRATEWGLKITF